MMNKFGSLMLVSITVTIVTLNMSCSTQELNKGNDISVQLQHQSSKEALARITADADSARIAIENLIREGKAIIVLQDDLITRDGSPGDKFNKSFVNEFFRDVAFLLEEKVELLIKERKLLEDMLTSYPYEPIKNEALDKLLRKGAITPEELEKRLNALDEQKIK